MKYKIGDKVRLPKERPITWVSSGAMDVYLDIVVTIESIGKDRVDSFTFKGSAEWIFLLCDCQPYKQPKLKDLIVKEVRKDLKARSNVGIKKYGVTLDRKDLDLLDWLQHAYEECLDQALYLKRAIKELKTNKK